MNTKNATPAVTHEKYAKLNPPTPPYKCGPWAITEGGGCYNCGWRTERDMLSSQVSA